MLDALYGVLPRRALTLAVPMIAACVVGTPLASAATPRPVRASSVQRVARMVEPPPLTMQQLDDLVSTFAGEPIQITCDPTGVPSAIDGNARDDGTDGEVFPIPGTDRLGPVIHVDPEDCYWATRANRVHDLQAGGYLLDSAGLRMDAQSGSGLLVLLHEAMHLRLQTPGVTPNPGFDEGIVECTTIENAWQIVRALHVTPYDSTLLLRGMRWHHEQFGTLDAGAPYRTVC